jgi:hypothetical protein
MELGPQGVSAVFCAHFVDFLAQWSNRRISMTTRPVTKGFAVDRPFGQSQVVEIFVVVSGVTWHRECYEFWKHQW